MKNSKGGNHKDAGTHGESLLLAQLRHELAACPQLDLLATDDGLEIVPKGAAGFPVVLQTVERGCYVDFGGCAQEFDDVASACAWVRRAVSSAYRLRIDLVGGVPSAWTLEPCPSSVDRVKLASGGSRMIGWLRSFVGPHAVVYRAFAPVEAASIRP